MRRPDCPESVNRLHRMNRTNCQNIVWDWNGTLLDDVQTGVDTLADMLCRRGITPLTVEEYKQTFCFPVIDFYRQTGFDLDKESMHDLSTDFVESYEKHAGSLTLVQDVPEVLAALHATGKRLYILSALREEELLRMTREYGIDSYFEKICGSDNIYANGKIDRGRQLVSACGIRPEETLMVGDTLHDAEVAQALGFRCVLYAGGHNDEARLRTATPVIHRLKEILSFV